jgi:ATP-dependent helicase/DNAse subunit B
MAYYGNPLDGLQIMGLLETRLLDFETIFVLGLNEGKMPPTNPIQTLIPMDLRRYMGLPTPREKQGLFAHHFYRLLHQCKQMVITYSTASESIHSNEQSRYVMQLEKELVRKNPLIRWQRKDYTLSNEDVVTRSVQIPKTDAIHKRLDELFAKGTSASAIKTFMTCPLDFYYKYVLKFGEEEKVEEELESNTFGTFIHEVLEEMYTPFARIDSEGKLKEKQPRSMQVEDIDWMLKNYEYEMRKKFSAHFNQEPEAYEKGKNFLSFSMALELTERFLKNERKILLELNNRPLFIEGLEQSLVYDLELEILGKKRNVRLKGNIDRIDSIDGKIRIIDYKTGKVNIEDVGPKENARKTFDSNVEAFVEWSQKNKHFFQLMVYNYLYYQHMGHLADSSSIVSFINLKESPFELRLGNYTTQELVDAFPAVLTQLIEAIYDPETNFVHREIGHFSYCVYC